jgi:hypothetical protein
MRQFRGLSAVQGDTDKPQVGRGAGAAHQPNDSGPVGL